MRFIFLLLVLHIGDYLTFLVTGSMVEHTQQVINFTSTILGLFLAMDVIEWFVKIIKEWDR